MNLSIVIPIYNVEATLQRCIESVVKQSYRNIEIILVDDGSTDNSPAICDHWKNKDQRIKVVHKDNGGLSDARNAGIQTATGEYITFIDSDDYIQEETLSSLMTIIQHHPEYDILEYPVYEFFGSSKGHILTFEEEEYDDMTAYWLQGKGYLHSYAWNKIYRKRLFEAVRYPVGRVFEDIATLPKLLKAAHRVATTALGLYYYCWNPNGIANSAGAHEWQTLLGFHLDIIKTADFNFESQAAQQYYMHVVNIQLYTHYLTGKSPSLPFVRITHWKEIAPVSSKVKALIINTFGINSLCRIFKPILAIKRNR